MGLASRIIKNSFFLSLAVVADRLAELALFFLLARSLGPGLVGDYRAITMYLRIFQNLTDFGLTQLVMREVAILPDRRQASALLMNYGFASVWIALALALVMNGVAAMVSYPRTIALGIALVSLALLPGAWRRVAEATISGLESMKYIALVSLAAGVLRVLVSALVVWQGGGLLALLLVLVVTQVAVVPAYLAVIHRFLSPVRLRPDLGYVRRMAREIGVFFVTGLLLMGVGTQLDVILVHRMRSSEEAGFFAAAATLVQTVLMVQSPMMQAILPNMSQLFQGSLSRFQALTSELLRFLVMTLLPLPLATMLLAKPLMPFLLGQSFAESAITLQVLVWILLPSFLYAALARALIASRQERLNLRIAAVGMVVGIALLLALIPIWGSPGAALASVLSMSLAATLGYIYVGRTLFPLPFRQIWGKPLLCVSLTVIAALPLRQATPWLSLPLLAGLYVLLLLLTKAIPFPAIRDLWRTIAGTRFLSRRLG